MSYFTVGYLAWIEDCRPIYKMDVAMEYCFFSCEPSLHSLVSLFFFVCLRIMNGKQSK